MATETAEVYAALGNLMGCIGVMDAIISQQEESPAKEGWEERKEELKDWADDQASQFMDFGSAYDE